MISIGKYLVILALLPSFAQAFGPGSSGGGAPAPENVCPYEAVTKAGRFSEQSINGLPQRTLEVIELGSNQFRVRGSSGYIGMAFIFDLKATQTSRGDLIAEGSIGEGRCPYRLEIVTHACKRSASAPSIVSVSASTWLTNYLFQPHVYDYSCEKARRSEDPRPISGLNSFSQSGWNQAEREAWLNRD